MIDALARPIAEVPGDQLNRPVVLDRAGYGDHRGTRAVAAFPVAVEIVASHGPDRFASSQDRALQRMTGEHGLLKLLEGDIVRVVLVHVDLFDDDLPLGVDFLLPECRALQHLTQQPEPLLQVVVQHPRPETRVLLAGEGVGLGAERVECLRDLPGAQRL